ncbi:MAG: UBP-type zinc finger domain-containing protein [Thermoproteota archaeon]|nr:UBP-type zinc finger domain-containing protein [Thermoproteota archaeon]
MLIEVSKPNQDQKQNACNHFKQVTENISATTTKDCEQCIKEGTRWVALRMCLSCGHVGCCDSSPGRHATRHFVDTDHPVMIALPNKAWRWCYIHKTYG